MHPAAALIERLGLAATRLAMLVSGGSGLKPIEFDTAPEDYLDQAEFDLTIGAPTSLIDAVSNAKRAIACEADRALSAFGVLDQEQPLPARLEHLEKMGFVSPRIVRRVTRARNALEHEYRKPTRAEAEDAVDVANLFVSAVERHMVLDDEFCLGDPEHLLGDWNFERELAFDFDEQQRAWRIWAAVARKGIGTATVAPRRSGIRRDSTARHGRRP